MTREAFGKALVEIGKDDRVFVIDMDLNVSTKTDLFKEKYPERFIQAGIAEQNAMGMGAGLAASGKIPFVVSYACFLCTRAFDQIRMSVAYPNLNVRICGTHAGIGVGEDGPSHQAIMDIGLMRLIPNMTVIQPADEKETRDAVRQLLEFKGPVYLRLTRQELPPLDSHRFNIGEGVVLRYGDDVTIIATGATIHIALEAAKKLNKNGIDAGVVNVHTLKPLDESLIIKCAKKTGFVLTVEDHSLGGLYSAVAEVLAENYPTPMKGIYIKGFAESGTWKELYNKHGLTASSIVKSVRSLRRIGR